MKPVAGLRCRPSHPVWLFPFQGGIQWQKQRTQHPQPPSRPHQSLSERLERPPTWWASISARRARKQWTIRCYVLSKTTFATPPCADKTTVKAGCELFIKCLQIKCTFCLDETLPKGSLICEVGQLLQRAKYRIAVLNTINFSKSMHYNPFAYLRTEKDILKLVNTIIVNTKGEGAQSTEDFWVKAERLYYTALIGYIHYEAPEEEKNFITLLDMINASDTREDDEDYKNPVDLLFDRLEEREPEHFAVKQYRKYKLAAGKTAKSILISCGARLAPFDIKELRDLMVYDEMELDTIGDKKTALFLIMSDTDSTFNFVIAILQSQLTNLLCDKADDVYGGRLPVHVRFILDEFANIGQIPQFDKLIATIRSREISASIILQSQSQLKAIYRDNADTIVGNCDTMLFLGGKEKTTLKEISEILGKETIDSFNTSENRGKEISHGLNYQKLGKELMTQDEIATMDGGMCILQLRGVRPFFSKKYDITKHPRYKYLSDADKKNTFDVERYIRVQRKKKKHPSAVIAPEEPFDLYEIELSDMDADFTVAVGENGCDFPTQNNST